MADNDTLISPVTTKPPEFVITRAPVNNEPVELDGKPLSPEEQKLAQAGEQAQAIEEEQRQQLISDRKDDPAVLVDIPQTPRADEFKASGPEA